MKRRNFIKYALLGIGAAAGVAGVPRLLNYTAPAVVKRELSITEALVEMVDRRDVYHWAFEDPNNPIHLPQMPGPLIEALDSDMIELSLTNNLPDIHGFRIPGVPGIAGEGIDESVRIKPKICGKTASKA